ncbi:MULTISPECIES: siderophore-interacting protein [Paenarthrobacter]|uniref:Siderophore-interacting protein n=1 Tax=Paenarthrobacter ureafaciens TaxID=37931 RepID=A0AAX3ENH6_PAEUR|nr:MULTISPECIES: siderophore-interacting protein [Paenarthrobacter]NKR11097.1 NADPH-dependent ferric siderophore reductase [Arthrobacter sp. M5]NKR15331.1 NADPH-dependent ferric siderophore reductase [Arthrobacter sp. M6]OEH59291.1 NADPH-dependent ferric siderophore reductase [Arthrobacter sp. D4]OEH59367.1 NADPH-dependent ferric siderophore reductase [Arthrobacter sp. D2]MDO5863609.1 siderophore-interacting protein [Paenarthrobacter sp. SD-2]
MNAALPATSSADRKTRPQVNLTVLRKEQLSPHMIRIIAGGPGFKDYAHNEYVDRYVKIVFPQPGVDYELPLDLWAIRESMPREQWPHTRTYTIRWVNLEAQELAIDFVVHGDEGLAGPWAAAAEPGDALTFTGPGGAYNPAPDADWYLFAGDDAAIPAIAASIEALTREARGVAFLEVDSADDVLQITAPAGVELHWLQRNGVLAGSSELLLESLRTMEWLPGRVDVFAHGERGYMKGLREIFFVQRGLERSQVSLSGYWAQGRVEEVFQAEKKLPVGKI